MGRPWAATPDGSPDHAAREGVRLARARPAWHVDRKLRLHMDLNTLWAELANGHLWLILSGAAIFGMLGALIHPPAAEVAGAPPPPPPPPGDGGAGTSQ